MQTLIDWHLINYSTGFVLMGLWFYSIFFVYSLYWHKAASHQQLIISPIFQHVIRFWLWINTTIWYHGHLTRFTAEHKIHHMLSDQPGDPLSPKNHHLKDFFQYGNSPGQARYVSAEQIRALGNYSQEPTDVLTMFYKRHQFKGIYVTPIVWAILLGPFGLLFGLLSPYMWQYGGTFFGDYMWHTFGYKHPNSNNQARNVTPWPLLEGLHSNHHANPRQANYAYRWWEIDLFYWQIKLLSLFKLVSFNEYKK